MAKRKRALISIVFAVIGVISGVSIFISFATLKNVNAAIWGLLSGIFAVMVLCLHIAYRKYVLLTAFQLKNLRLLKQFGAFGSFASIISAITYFTLAHVLKQGYKAEDDGYMPAAIFSLLTLKWTALLFFHSRKYEKLHLNEEETKPIGNGGPV